MWPFRNKTKQVKPIMIRARYDAAQTTGANARHWVNADSLSANEANSAHVRRVLRTRGRYECANNTYARGMVNTLANDLIGTGPSLHLGTGNADGDKLVVAEFMRWANNIGLAEKLRTFRMARAESGEGFGLLITNPLLASRVKLDVRLIETDQCAHSTFDITADNAVDGLEFDKLGNITHYHILKSHPGDAASPHLGDDDRIPAAQVIHYFRPTRPGQFRGIPDLTAALPLFAQLRRYTLATIAAAETAANFAAVIYTDSPADGESSDEFEAFDPVELERNMATTLPGGWKLGQLKAEQPTTTYSEFKTEILNEIARVLSMPFNIAAGNSSKYNYASGRMDHQAYFAQIDVERRQIERTILDRIFTAWLAEASKITDYLPQSYRTTRPLGQSWHWPGHEHVDPAKEATAQSVRLASHTTTLAAEYARQGKDWEVELRQRAKEKTLMDELGLCEAEVVPVLEDDDADD